MNIFIDCEFNDFKGELISMALVDIEGNEWYESLGCTSPSKWVFENVMPVIGKKSISIEEMQSSLHEFLSHYKAVHIVADWPEDISHFCETLITKPGYRIDTPPLSMEIRRDLDSVSNLPHNALEDARAIRLKWLSQFNATR